jgi:hypothetical protein
MSLVQRRGWWRQRKSSRIGTVAGSPPWRRKTPACAHPPPHRTQQCHRTRHIVVVITQRLAHRLAHGLERGKVITPSMGCCANTAPANRHRARHLDKRGCTPVMRPLQHRAAAVAKVVQNQMGNTGRASARSVRTDEAGSACDKNRYYSFTPGTENSSPQLQISCKKIHL